MRHPDGQLQEVREHGGGDQQESLQTASSSRKVNIIVVTRKIKLRNIIQCFDVLYNYLLSSRMKIIKCKSCLKS